MTTRLKKVKVHEVSLVTRPAIGRQFLLYKSEDGLQEEEVMTEEVIKTEETKVEEPVAEAPVTEVAKEEAPAVELAVEPVVQPEPVVEVIPEPIVEKAAEPVVQEVSKEMEEISKALEMERIEKAALVKELEELKKAAYEARQVEITKAYIEKASVDMKHIPTVVADKFGPILKAASEKLEKSEFDAIYGVLKAANTFIAQNSTLTKELGVGGEDLSADPAAQLDSIAKSIVQKDVKLTYAKAYEMACMNNPKLYAEHVRQARGR
jgi:hypothetical protein